MTENKQNNEGRTSGIDVGGLGDYVTMAVKTVEGKEIETCLYGR